MRSVIQNNKLNYSGERGFSLMELVIVMTILAILVTIAVPVYNAHIRHAREVVLRQDLDAMRRAIDNYTVDKQQAPQSLEDLASTGYLRKVPVDPFTKTSDSWIIEQESEPFTPDAQIGIKNVRSGAEGSDSTGVAYSEY